MDERRERKPTWSEGELRVHGVAVALVLAWFAYASLRAVGPLLEPAEPMMADLAQFLAGARLMADGDWHLLYDGEHFQNAVSAVTPWQRAMIYPPVYPPQTYAAFIPLIHFSYAGAAWTWMLLSLALYASCIVLLTYPGRPSVTLVCLACGNPALLRMLMAGQLGCAWLLGVTLAWQCWRQDRRFLAGLCFGSLGFKPQLLAIGLCAVLARPSKRLVVGMAAALALHACVMSAVLGADGWSRYLHTIARAAAHPEVFTHPNQLISLKGMVELALGNGPAVRALYVLSACGVLALVWRIGRQVTDRRVPFAAAVIAGLLISPHTYVYDAIVLSAPLALIAASVLQKRRATTSDKVAYALYWSPLLIGAAAVTHIQMTPVLGLSWMGLTAAGRPSGELEAGNGPRGER